MESLEHRLLLAYLRKEAECLRLRRELHSIRGTDPINDQSRLMAIEAVLEVMEG